MYKAIKNINTGHVYDWIKTYEDGSSISVNVPEELWKTEQEWSEKELEALFNEPIDSLFIEPTSTEPNSKTKKKLINRLLRR